MKIKFEISEESLIHVLDQFEINLESLIRALDEVEPYTDECGSGVCSFPAPNKWVQVQIFLREDYEKAKQGAKDE